MKLEEVIQAYRSLKLNADAMKPLWTDISNYVAPVRGIDDLFGKTPGARRGAKLYDSTAPLGARELASALTSFLIGPTTKWMTLAKLPGDYNRVTDEETDWLQPSADVLLGLYASQMLGFYPTMDEVFLDAVSYGTCCEYTGESNKLPYFRSCAPDSLCIAENDMGVVDTVFRTLRLTAHAAAGLWGPELLSAEAKKDLEDPAKRYVVERDYVHYVGPGDERTSAWYGDDKKFQMMYLDIEAKHLIQEDGLRRQRYAVARWSKPTGAVYGWSPALTVLEGIMAMNEFVKEQIHSAQQVTDPALIAPSGVFQTLDRSPGAVNTYIPGFTLGRNIVEAIPHGTPVGIDVAIERLQEQIRKAFMLDKLTLPQQDRMTSAEVNVRRSGEMKFFGPFVARLQAELIGPIVANTLDIAEKSGMIPQRPESLRGKVVVEYSSPMAISQKISDVETLAYWLQQIVQFAAVDKYVVNYVDMGEAIEDSAKRLNVNNKYVRPRQEAEALTAQQKQLEQAQQAAEVMKNAAPALAGGNGAR